jgi:hypothetical protein
MVGFRKWIVTPEWVPRLQLGFAEPTGYGIAFVSHRNCNLLEIFQDRQFLLKR